MSSNHEPAATHLDSRNAAYVEGLLAEYLKDAESVPPVWRDYFRQLADGNSESLAPPKRPSFKPRSLFNPGGNGAVITHESVDAEKLLQHRADMLVVGYRVHGHLAAKLDPLGLAPRSGSPLNLSNYGLTPADLDRDAMTTFGGRDSRPMPLRNLIERLTRTYCDHIGFEYMH